MGLLGFVAGGIGDAGQKVAAKAGDYLEKSTLQDEANAAQALRDKTLHDMREQSTIAAEQRAPGVAAATATAKGQAEEDLAARNAPAQIARATAAYEAKVQAEANPKNVELRANAKAQEEKILAESAAALLAQQMKDPSFLKNRQALVAAEHPERVAAAAASMAAAAKAKFELSTEKEISEARKGLAAAATPEAKDTAKKTLEALQWSVASDRAQKTADVGVMKVLQDQIHDKQLLIQNPMTDPAVAAAEKRKLDALESTLGAYQKRYADEAGVKTDAPKPSGPAKPTSAEEVKALPPGTEFINPADGKVYRTKGPAAAKPAESSSLLSTGKLPEPVRGPEASNAVEAAKADYASMLADLEAKYPPVQTGTGRAGAAIRGESPQVARFKNASGGVAGMKRVYDELTQ